MLWNVGKLRMFQIPNSSNNIFVEMSRIRLCFLAIFLCTITINCYVTNEELVKNIEKFVKTSDAKQYNMVNVKVCDNEEYGIYLYQSKENLLKTLLDTVYAFYITFNCNVAQWCVNTIYEFTNELFLFQNNSRHDTKNYKKNFNDNFWAFKIAVQENIGALIHILNHLLNLNSENVFYLDSSVIEALVLLEINVDIISTHNKHLNTDDSTHYGIIQVFMQNMNAFQSFLSMNCSRVNSAWAYINSYGYWITFENHKKVQLINFFNSIVVNVIHLELEKLPICSTNYVLLENIAKPPWDDDVSTTIADTYILVVDNNQEHTSPTRIRDVYDRIQKSYDIELIYLYHDSVLTAIMKIIFKEMLNGLQYSITFVRNFQVVINDLYGLISKANVTLPDYLIDGVTILSTNCNRNTPIIVELERFHDALTSVQLNTNTKDLNRIGYLIIILQKICLSIDHFQCFQHSYRFISNKNNQYRGPFAENEKVLNPYYKFEDVINFEYLQMCDFVMNVYSMCVYVYDFADKTYSDLSIEEADNFIFSETHFKVLRQIQNYFLLIIKKGTNDKGLLKMAYTIASILLNIFEKSHVEIVLLIVRALDVIMTELNKNKIKYCAASKKEYLLFKNVNYLVDDESFELSMSIIFVHILKEFNSYDLDFSNLDIRDYDYLSVRQMHTILIKRSKIFKTYKNDIQFYWNGQIKTVESIFEDTAMSLINSLNLFALYDMFFKFYISIVYLEIKIILASYKHEQIETLFKMLTELCKLEYGLFPRELKPLILIVQNLLKFQFNSTLSEKTISTQLSEHERKIDLQMEKLSIVLDIKERLKHGKYLNLNLNLNSINYSYEHLEQFNNELFDNVYVKKFLSMLNHFKEDGQDDELE